MKEILGVQLIRLDRKSPMLGDSMICTEMSGSGAKTVGMTAIKVRQVTAVLG